GHAIEPPTPGGVLESPHGTYSDHWGVRPARPGGVDDRRRRAARYVVFLVSFMRAALPRRARRKYSFARRTRAERTTSTFAIVGECSGKIRSTPWPKETLRTVNDARTP